MGLLWLVACATGGSGDPAGALPTGETAEAGAEFESGEDAGVRPRDAAASPDSGPARQDAGRDAGRDTGGAVATNPAPVLTGMSPTTAPAGATTGVTLTLTGSSFVATSYAMFSGNPLATTFVSATQLTAVVPPTSLLNAGRFPVKVRTPSPGGGESAALELELTLTAATVTAIAPTQASAGSGAIDLTVTGTAFASNALVAFDGATQPTTRFSATELRATLTASHLATGRTIQVAVVHGATSLSNAVPFSVVNASPTLSTIAPTLLAPGSPATVVAVSGTGFSGATVVTADGTDVATTFVSGTQVNGVVPAARLAVLGPITIGARNPAPGGGVAPTTATLMVANPVPTVTRLAPAGVVAGAGTTTLTLTGTGFVQSSEVRVDGTPVTTRWQSTSSLQADVPATMLATGGNRSVTVFTPAPGGGTSAASTFTVYGVATCADTTNVDTPLGAPGSVYTKTLNLANAPRVNRIQSYGTCPVSVSTQQEPTRAYVVQNTLNGNVVLSAWAVCGASQDAYLTFYRRGSAPATNAEIQACASEASEGSSGGGKGSPESGGSTWCPGLTKANGGGLTLAPCEKAVVWIQPYSFTSTIYPPPPTLKISVEMP